LLLWLNVNIINIQVKEQCFRIGMTSALHKRLEKLEALLAARVAPPIFKWMMDCNGDPAAELERLVSSGEVAERDKGRVKIWRWLTDEEALARGIVQPEPRNPAQPQLPAPLELKLLAPPSSAPAEPAPPVQAKRALTEEQMRKWLDARDRPFGKPIPYPKGMATP
jgi:hypothetical protein